MRKFWLLFVLMIGGACVSHAQAPPQANVLTYCTASNGTVAICPSGTAGASTNLYPQGSVVTYCLSTQGAIVPCPPGGGGSGGAAFPVTTGLVANTSTTSAVTATSSQVQSTIGSGVYDSFGAASGLLSSNNTWNGTNSYTKFVPAPTPFFGIVSAGDSRFAGQNANITSTQNFIAQLNTQPQFAGRTTFATNGAVAGSTCSTMASNYTSHVYPSRPAANGGVQVFQYVMEGINDIRTSVSFATWSSCYMGYLQTITADGFTPVLATTYYDASNFSNPLGAGATDLLRLQFNNFIRSLQGQVINGQTVHVFDADNAIGVSNDLTYATSMYNTPQANYAITGYSVASGVGTFTTSAANPPAASTTATFTASSASITVASAAGIVLGQYITATGIPAGDYVASITGTTIGLAPSNTTAIGTATAAIFNSPVLLSGFPSTSACLNASQTATVTYVSATQFTMPVSCPNVTSSTDTGLAQAMYLDGLHLNPQAVATVLAPAANRDFALYNSGTPVTGTPPARNDFINPMSGTLYVVGNIKASGTVGPTTLIGTTALQSTTSTANDSAITSTGGTAKLDIKGSNSAEFVEFNTGSTWQVGTCHGTADLVICNGTSALYPFDISTTAPTGTLALTSAGIATNGHVNQTASGNYAAKVTIASGASSGSFSFSAAYTSVPVCVGSPESSPGATITATFLPTTGGVTVTLSSAATATSTVFDVICIGNPN